MNARLTLAAIALASALVLLGYFWPQPSPNDVLAASDDWALPAPLPREPRTELPANLATYWPGRKPTSSTAAATDPADSTPERRNGIDADRHHPPGQQPQRPGTGPAAQYPTLKPGDRLDEARTVRQLAPTALLWQDDRSGTGERCSIQSPPQNRPIPDHTGLPTSRETT